MTGRNADKWKDPYGRSLSVGASLFPRSSDKEWWSHGGLANCHPLAAFMKEWRRRRTSGGYAHRYTPRRECILVVFPSDRRTTGKIDEINKAETNSWLRVVVFGFTRWQHVCIAEENAKRASATYAPQEEWLRSLAFLVMVVTFPVEIYMMIPRIALQSCIISASRNKCLLPSFGEDSFSFSIMSPACNALIPASMRMRTKMFADLAI